MVVICVPSSFSRGSTPAHTTTLSLGHEQFSPALKRQIICALQVTVAASALIASRTLPIKFWVCGQLLRTVFSALYCRSSTACHFVGDLTPTVRMAERDTPGGKDLCSSAYPRQAVAFALRSSRSNSSFSLTNFMNASASTRLAVYRVD